jgi:hypothetical protein
MMKRLLPAALLLFVSAAAFAGEGKWTPAQVRQLDPAWLKAQGLQLPPERLWDPDTGTGLLAGAVSVGGCSAGFISPDGLFITNHHCLFGILQEHATAQDDIITNGFLARSREQELKGQSLKVNVPRAFIDVTAKVLAAIPAKATDAERYRAIDRKENELVAECETRPATRCRVATFDGGLQYILVDTLELGDIRLVYAPPRAIGEYGGEVDNWMWPRHTGDFAIGRAYVDGKPYHSEHYFPLSVEGVKPGDFVMVLGYPGVTYRALTAAEMSERRDLFFTRRRELYGEWIEILESSTKGNEAATILVADNLKSLYNRFKNADGQLTGFKRGRILEKQQEADSGVLEWAGKHAQYADAAAAYKGLTAMIEEQRKTWERDYLLSQLAATGGSTVPPGPKSLFFATTVARASLERGKPDADRDPLYMQRNLPRVRERLEREQKNYFAPADRRILASVVRRALALPQGQRLEAIDLLFPAGTDIEARIDQLYGQTKIFDLGERLKMLEETPDQLLARKDPLVSLGFALDRDLRDLSERRDRWDGTVTRLRPVWRRAVAAHSGKPLAPDANSTLRVSFAHVGGYQPRDGVFHTPQTTLAGVVEKDTGVEPFHAPKTILEAARERRASRWQDPRLKDVPVDFLADADTTGGNSGSPVVNGRGELVGVNFDRVWENVANDFGYNPDVARNVSVDVRYLLWILDQIEHAQPLMQEMGVK